MNCIPARVYVLNASDAAALKKLLEYDPYLDPNLAPKIPKEWDDPKYMEKHPEVAQEAARRGTSIAAVIRAAIDRLSTVDERRRAAVAAILAAEPMALPDHPAALRRELDDAHDRTGP